MLYVSVNPLGPLLSVSQENLGPTAEVATPVKRVPSTSSMSGMSIGLSSVYGNIWKVLIQLMNDPMPKVAEMAKTLTTRIKAKVSARCVQTLKLGVLPAQKTINLKQNLKVYPLHMI